ncbi:hypothetical protein BK809_0000066 [Diplodia seriata]|uniref:1-alkyl-2-acetylglycerophosphocholine esterase n=1 Tax=Diplodia seriata TaxID=420778 RepID=A0A1S8BAG9_9PEZI|nr:hypothetical protein BK809_0000066 [Diplodia seriata]
MKPIAASALALLGIASISARAEILLYEPTGPYHVTQTQHVFNHTTPDDFTAPNGTGEGTQMLVTIYAPTLSAPNRTLPYIDATNAFIWGPALGLSPSALSTFATPLQPSDSAPLHLPPSTPTLLFLPGAGMPCFFYTSLLSELASHGYFVVALDHPGEPPYLPLPDGYGGGGAKGAFPPLHNYTWMQYERIYKHRVADAQALLSDGYLSALVRERGWGARLDLGGAKGVGVFGHSIGGAAAAGVMAAQQQQQQGWQQQQAPFSSPADANATTTSTTVHVAAGANLDGWYFFDIGDLTGNGTGTPYPDLARAGPFLALAKDQEPRGAPPDATWARFGAAQSGWLRDVGVRRAGHFDFCDFPLLVDGVLGPGEKKGGGGGGVGGGGGGGGEGDCGRDGVFISVVWGRAGGGGRGAGGGGCVSGECGGGDLGEGGAGLRGGGWGRGISE